MIPTNRFLKLAFLSLLPAVLAVPFPTILPAILGFDIALVILAFADAMMAPSGKDLTVERAVLPQLASGRTHEVSLRIESLNDRTLRGVARDDAPLAITHSMKTTEFQLAGRGQSVHLRYTISPANRGDLHFGDAHLRLIGLLGLGQRQIRIPLPETVRVLPDVSSLQREALRLAASRLDAASHVVRKRSDGSEFESLREYRAGDDYRVIDWKASARRSRLIVRNHQPERNQTVMLLLDCGRAMAGRMEGRHKLDHAVDAALRLTRICLAKGDQVGLLAFASEPLASLPPRRGLSHLRALTQATYDLQARLEESDVGAAIDLSLARHPRRTLVVLFSDLADPDSSRALMARTNALRPRHLPLVVSLIDEDLKAAAQNLPHDVHQAHVRAEALKIARDFELTTQTQRNAGAKVVRASAQALSAQTLNAYLDIKARGLL